MYKYDSASRAFYTTYAVTRIIVSFVLRTRCKTWRYSEKSRKILLVVQQKILSLFVESVACATNLRENVSHFLNDISLLFTCHRVFYLKKNSQCVVDRFVSISGHLFRLRLFDRVLFIVRKLRRRFRRLFATQSSKTGPVHIFINIDDCRIQEIIRLYFSYLSSRLFLAHKLKLLYF